MANQNKIQLLYFGVGVIPNRQLKSATQLKPLVGGLGEIPEPTVKVRMREIQRAADLFDLPCSI